MSCAQMSLGEGDMDVIYMNGWVGVFQLLLTLPAALPSAAIQHMPLSQVHIICIYIYIDSIHLYIWWWC